MSQRVPTKQEEYDVDAFICLKEILTLAKRELPYKHRFSEFAQALNKSPTIKNLVSEWILKEIP